MTTAVKREPKGQDVTPETLRTFLARHRIRQSLVAERYGCNKSYICGVVNGAQVASQAVLRRIKQIAQAVLWEREVVHA